MPQLPGRIAALGAALCIATFAPASLRAASPDVVISQIYGGGGNAGATLRHDFIELFNRGSAPVDVSGWSVQYAAAAGTTWQVTPLPSTVLAPGQYLLVQEAVGAGGTQPLPAPDATGTIAMSATAGKVALVIHTTALACGSACAGDPAVRDLIGYGGTASSFEGAPAPGLSNTTAALRAANGCTDSDNNSADFASAAPTPRNGAATLQACGAPVNQPVMASCPANLSVFFGTSGQAVLSASDADGIVTAGTLAGAPAGISLAFSPATATGGTAAGSLEVGPATARGAYDVQVQFSNNDTPAQTAGCTIRVSVVDAPITARIREIQGAGHISPLVGRLVAGVEGIVTALRSNGFYMQDPLPDADPATSEGIFVFTSSAPTVSVGDALRVGGTVSEFRAGGASGLTNLTITEIVTPVVSLLSSGNPLPEPVVIGMGGRMPPSQVINSGNCGDVELPTCTFDPANDGIDFWESLEGMRVRINNALATGPTNGFGEISVVADMGVNAGPRTVRGGVRITAGDFNPERVFLDDGILPVPVVNLGDWFPQVTGVLDYSFGNFKLQVTEPLVVMSGGLQQEVTRAQGAQQLATAPFTREELAPGHPTRRFATLAGQIVTNLRSPDIVALMEVQDNSGAVNDGVVDATLTFNRLIAAIQAAGGPAYEFRSVNPVDGQDGGEPGGNIRVGFLFNPARVAFVDRPGGTPTAATAVVAGGDGPQLSFSPGRIDPANPAFNNSRKPLAGEFVFNRHRLFVIANHFNSKGGDQPLFGRFQPPVLVSEAQRTQQAGVVRDFVRAILALDAGAKVVVLGDLNDFEFSAPLAILKSASLNDLVEQLPPEERYTYVFEGNSQVLDHILVSDSLMRGVEYDVVHVNSEFADQASDHEPEVARLFLPRGRAHDHRN